MMAIGAAVGIGAGMAAAGGAISAGAMKVKGTTPKLSPYQYGGSVPAAQGYRQNYGDQVNQAQTLANPVLAQFGTSGLTAQQQGLGTLTQALQAGGFGGEGGADLSGMDPGEAARLQSAATVQDLARRTNAIGRTGGALGLRAALNANAGMGATAARDAGIVSAQAEQQAIQAKMQNQQLINATRFGLAGAGAQQQQFGAGLQGQLLDAGMAREGMYNQQLSAFEQVQLQAQIAQEQARQQSQIDKRRLIAGLGAGLIGAGGTVMASGMGGGGGGGGGAGAIGSMGAGGVTNWGGRM